MQALSYLLRHDDAIATATRLLDLGTWHIADANYWRAWNRYHLKEYDAAWEDVENATKGLSNGRVYMLAGLIAYARKDLPIAVAALRSRVTSSTAAPATRRGCRDWSASIRTSWRSPRRSSRAA